MTNPRTIAGEPVLISEPDHDREQHRRVQKFFWDARGNPVFGEPVANTPGGMR